MKSDYQYSNSIVYNNFPWPQAETAKQRQAIEEAAQAVLDARAKYPDAIPCRSLRPPDHAPGFSQGAPQA
jgi:hypothetical protein